MTSIMLLKRHLYSLKTWERTALLAFVSLSPSFAGIGNVSIKMQKKATLK
jgi:hypothetical protein